MEELKACPFCGGDGFTDNTVKMLGKKEYWAYCGNCGVEMELSKTKADAIKAWNTREGE